MHLLNNWPISPIENGSVTALLLGTFWTKEVMEDKVKLEPKLEGVIKLSQLVLSFCQLLATIMD